MVFRILLLGEILFALQKEHIWINALIFFPHKDDYQCAQTSVQVVRLKREHPEFSSGCVRPYAVRAIRNFPGINLCRFETRSYFEATTILVEALLLHGTCPYLVRFYRVHSHTP